MVEWVSSRHTVEECKVKEQPKQGHFSCTSPGEMGATCVITNIRGQIDLLPLHPSIPRYGLSTLG